MVGHQKIVPIFFWPAFFWEKSQPQGRGMSRNVNMRWLKTFTSIVFARPVIAERFYGVKIIVVNIFTVADRPAKIRHLCRILSRAHRGTTYYIDFIRRNIIAQKIAAHFGRPNRARYRMNRHEDRIPKAYGKVG